MRLSQKEIQNILTCITKKLNGTFHQVYLFGSRTDDKKKGGDIDLLLKVSADDYEKVHAIKSILKFDLEGAVGDQRVDLTIATEKNLHQDVFLISIHNEMTELVSPS